MEIIINPSTIKDMSSIKWITDNAYNNCMLCQLPFSFNWRRHHCRLCGSLLCEACCPEAEPRVCIICVKNQEIDSR